ncbi:TPA: phosphoribosyltransferase, partial [Staphylococcus pseudintermedius]|nr:phosphoribosyltransferase [Staphylococcus pseudintermedius]
KSTEINSSFRRQLDSSRHFETLHLNPKFKNKLKGVTVVVLDDYVTNGHTFEAVRNLLTEAGVKKIYLITMGTFKMPYQIQQVDFKDDISNLRYKFEIISKENITLQYNENALITIDQIYEIITDK